MITLYGFGPAFGLPDPSPFVMKVQVLLKMAGLDYEMDPNGFRKAPKGKIPYIRDGEQVVSDSSFIRDYLETKYAADFDQGLSETDRAIGYAFEKLCEDNLYWVVVHDRWCVDENFKSGPASFFKAIPAPVRMVMTPMIRRKVRGDVHSQGTGRHSDAEIATIGVRALSALSEYLGDKPYFMGDRMTGTDATVFSFVTGALCPRFKSETTEAAGNLANLVAYRDRLMAEFFPELSD